MPIRFVSTPGLNMSVRPFSSSNSMASPCLGDWPATCRVYKQQVFKDKFLVNLVLQHSVLSHCLSQGWLAVVTGCYERKTAGANEQL